MMFVEPTETTFSHQGANIKYYNINPTSNAPDTSIEEWTNASNKTYAKDELVQITPLKRFYKSSKDGNTDFPPSSKDTWTDMGAINSFKVFDNILGTQTVFSTELILTFSANNIDLLSILNLENVYSLHVKQVEGTNTVIDKAVDLRDFGSRDWFEYFFLPIREHQNHSLFSLEIVPQSTVTLTLKGGTNAKVGGVITGFKEDLGMTLVGATVGLIDESSFFEDKQQNISFLKGNVAVIIEGEEIIDRGDIDYTFFTLNRLNKRLILLIGDERDQGFRSLTTLGYLKETKIPTTVDVATQYPFTFIGGK